MTAPHFAYAIAGPVTTQVIHDLERQIGTATPREQGAVQNAFNTACLEKAQLSDGPYTFVFEKVAKPGGGEGIIVKCPNINGEFYVPDDCCTIKEWQYLQVLDMAKPVTLKPQTFSL